MEEFSGANMKADSARPTSIGFVFTNFNNSELTLQALESIFSAAGENDCRAVIVDNCSDAGQTAILKAAEGRFERVQFVYSPVNTGYFAGLNIGIRKIKEEAGNQDFLVVGNNDLVFSEDFFRRLREKRTELSSHPVISPDLVTLDGVHQNPHVIARVSRFRELVWDVYFSNYWCSLLIRNLASVGRNFFERKDYLSYEKPGHIYQGYGACYLLTPEFFAHFSELWAPGFLMGEEFFLSKQLESKGFQVFYEPSLRVVHHDHATVSKVPSRKMWEFTRDYHKIYRSFISPYRLRMDNKKSYTSISVQG
jgi:GT2 family glycosyltransferase